MANCFGREKIAAKMKMKMFMPVVAKIAVVTGMCLQLGLSNRNEFY